MYELSGKMNRVLPLIFSFIILATSCKQSSTKDLVSEWISENAIHIRTAEAGNGFEDLLPLGKMVDDTRIVALGEPTHGNREVFQLKHRLI